MKEGSLLRGTMTRLTVKQLASLSGVSGRTLHYYDEIDLLKPASVGGNGYRYYDQDSALRLQQILFFRELGFSLNDIKGIMLRDDFDMLYALEQHRSGLAKRAERLKHLITTVDRTIAHLKGNTAMSKDDIFNGFNEAQENEWVEEAREQYDPELVDASVKRWNSYDDDKKSDIRVTYDAVFRAMQENRDKGIASFEVQEQVARLHRNIENFYECPWPMFRALAEGYESSPDFNANISKYGDGLPTFVKDAVAYFCDQQEAKGNAG